MTRQHRIGLVLIPLLSTLLAGGGALYAGRLERRDSAVSVASVRQWRELLARVERGEHALPPAHVAPTLRQSLDAAEAERALSSSAVDLARSLGAFLAITSALQVYLVLRATAKRRTA